MIAPLLAATASTLETLRCRLACLERTVFSCDYNGWADVPEDEREAIDAFESSIQAPADSPPARVTQVSALPAGQSLRRKAA